jgi:preprotein translocase subunit SecA
MALTKSLLDGSTRKLKAMRTVCEEVTEHGEELAGLSDGELAAKTSEFRTRLAEGETLDDLMVEAFAVAREAAERVLGMRPYDEQVMAGVALHLGWVAEMRTGEGKTLAAVLPTYLNALTGTGAHVITVNDYLAARDAAEMGRVHEFLGLTVGCITSTTEDRRDAYHSDVTYGTATEMGFDYLRDNMAIDAANQVHRPLADVWVVVDEADQVFIDEARTPLLISGPGDPDAESHRRFFELAEALEAGTHYDVDEKDRVVVVNAEGIAVAEEFLGVDNLYDLTHTPLVALLNAAMNAKELYRRDRDYVVADRQVFIVDSFTGRVLRGRRWGDGLHQAVEAREGVEVLGESQTYATITYQNFFRLYGRVSGMSGTVMGEVEELGHIYGLHPVAIPTHRPVIRVDHDDLVFKTLAAKMDAIVEMVQERTDRGQPVLIGTASVEHSEDVSARLAAVGIDHQVLNAKQHAREALIIAQAGHAGAVTVATNMAGRGTDILLGGNPRLTALGELADELGVEVPADPFAADALMTDHAQRYEELLTSASARCALEAEAVRDAGGLFVLGTERHTARRIDDQLRGRSGRQGDPGESCFLLSLEDDLMRVYAEGAVTKLLGKSLPDSGALTVKSVSKAVERAQEAIESRDVSIREIIAKYDSVFDVQRRTVYSYRQSIIDGDGETLVAQVRSTLDGVIRPIVEEFCVGRPSEWDLDETFGLLNHFFPGISQPWVDGLDPLGHGSVGAFADALVEHAGEMYDERMAAIPEPMRAGVFRLVILPLVDRHWRTHLHDLHYLRSGIHLRAIIQTDPVAAWRQASYDMFSEMWQTLKSEAIGTLFTVRVGIGPSETSDDTAGDDTAGDDTAVDDTQPAAGSPAAP